MVKYVYFSKESTSCVWLGIILAGTCYDQSCMNQSQLSTQNMVSVSQADWSYLTCARSLHTWSTDVADPKLHEWRASQSWAFLTWWFCSFCEWWKWRMFPNLKIVHPGRLTWNLRIHPWKVKRSSKPSFSFIFSFYVNPSGVYDASVFPRRIQVHCTGRV